MNAPELLGEPLNKTPQQGEIVVNPDIRHIIAGNAFILAPDHDDAFMIDRPLRIDKSEVRVGIAHGNPY